MTKTSGSATETNTYDCFNRLIGFTKTGTTASYAYKPDGLRLSKTVNGTKTTHVWDGSNIVADLNSSGVTIDKYIRGIGLISSDSSGYFLFNGHGDVVQLTNTSGTVTKNYQYDAFGVEVNKVETDSNTFRYCGEYYDKETDTIYLRARYYSPKTGRFTQQDGWEYQKTTDPLCLNLYTYCGNNPILNQDPNGHFFISVPTIIAIISIVTAVVVGACVAYDSYQKTGQIDWVNSITAGISSGLAVYTVGMTLYEAYLILAMYKGFEPVTGFNVGSTNASTPKVGTITGSTQGFNKDEMKFAEELKSSGNNVELMSRSTVEGKGMYDFKVNGVSTELKTLQNANVNTGVTRIQDGFKQDNPTVVIIDARSTGLTPAQANEMINRAAGSYENKTLPGIVQVWTDDGIILGGKK